MDWNALLQSIADWVMNTGIKIIIAIVLLLVCFRVITVLCRRLIKRGEKKNWDKTIVKVLANILGIALKCLVAVCLVGYLGIDTSGITALITSMGVCIGLAVNGAMSNFAGGIMIILTRPFKVDDYIEACGCSGTVEDIRIVTTKIRTPDNKTIYIPNGKLQGDTIVNYSEKDIRRVDITFSIGYGDDFEKAKGIISQLCEKHEKILADPAPFVRVTEQGSSSINIVMRAWCNSADYWDVYFDMMESVKKRFDEEGIEIPFEQLDVHVKNS